MIKQVIEVTCDMCGETLDKRCGVSLETGQQDIKTHEIDLCHECACYALQVALDDLVERLVGDKYDWLLDVVFAGIERIDK
jgi:hypothetical protein